MNTNINTEETIHIPTFEQYTEAKDSLQMCKNWIKTVKEEKEKVINKLCDLQEEEHKYNNFIIKLNEMILIYETAHQGEQK